MKKLIAGALIGAALAGTAAQAVSGTESKIDRRDAITCPRATQEDDRLWNFKRLDDGRARIVVFCP